MMEDGSMTLPASSSSTLVTSRKATTPRLCPSIQSAMSWGICSWVIRKENRTALVMIYSSMADMLAESSRTFGIFANVMSL